jgi:hypothetical protein
MITGFFAAATIAAIEVTFAGSGNILPAAGIKVSRLFNFIGKIAPVTFLKVKWHANHNGMPVICVRAKASWICRVIRGLCKIRTYSAPQAVTKGAWSIS